MREWHCTCLCRLMWYIMEGAVRLFPLMELKVTLMLLLMHWLLLLLVLLLLETAQQGPPPHLPLPLGGLHTLMMQTV